jgi:nicotinate-nucleotide--dimethylbenzimidazole phosphoribosyltransferase
MSAILQIPVEECTGLGTGVNDEQLAIKKATLKKVFALHGLDKLAASPLELLSKAGGFEIAEMVGAYLQAYEEKMIIVVDGFIATSALLLATLITPQVTGNCIYAHTSSEKGHAMLLDYLKAKPLLELKLRLGEGTGAALAIPIIQSAVNFLNQMASFETAAVSNRTT